jgi:hypothetical protein
MTEDRLSRVQFIPVTVNVSPEILQPKTASG